MRTLSTKRDFRNICRVIQAGLEHDHPSTIVDIIHQIKTANKKIKDPDAVYKKYYEIVDKLFWGPNAPQTAGRYDFYPRKGETNAKYVAFCVLLAVESARYDPDVSWDALREGYEMAEDLIAGKM